MSKLKLIRMSQGLPIAAVAVRAKVGTSTLVMIERHHHEPRVDTKQRIAAALGVDVASIWPCDRGDGHSPPTAA